MIRLLLVLLALVLPSAALAGPGTVAVLYFENQGNPELQPLRIGLSQMLITDLRGTPGVTVVERAQLQAVLDELELGHSGKVDEATAARIGKLLGAEWLVLGSYFELMGTLRVDARLVRVETGEIQHGHGVNGASSSFLELEKELAGSFRGALEDLAGPPPAEKGATGALEPTRSQPSAAAGSASAQVEYPDARALDAAMKFSEGLIYLDDKDVPRAREAFEQALVADPRLDAARSELAQMDL